MNIRAGLTNGKTITIYGYDLELGKFDCVDGVTRSFEDFAYFIIPSEEFQAIGKRLNKANQILYICKYFKKRI